VLLNNYSSSVTAIFPQSNGGTYVFKNKYSFPNSSGELSEI